MHLSYSLRAGVYVRILLFLSLFYRNKKDIPSKYVHRTILSEYLMFYFSLKYFVIRNAGVQLQAIAILIILRHPLLSLIFC